MAWQEQTSIASAAQRWDEEGACNEAPCLYSAANRCVAACTEEPGGYAEAWPDAARRRLHRRTRRALSGKQVLP